MLDINNINKGNPELKKSNSSFFNKVHQLFIKLLNLFDFIEFKRFVQ